jgi:hypothetical protein
MIDVTGNWASGNDRPEVHHPHEEEQRDHQRDVLLALALAERLVDDAAAYEVVTGLGDHLELAGNNLRLPEGRPEETDDDDRAEQGQQHRLVEVDVAVRVTKDRLEQKRVQAGSRETTTVEDVAIGLEGEHLCRVSTHRGLLQRGA